MVADTNRDGTVDFVKDVVGRAVWIADRGAVFVNNCDRDDANQAVRQPDYADAIVNGTADLADLALIRVRHEPSLTALSTLTLTVGTAAQTRVRVFRRASNGTYVDVALGQAGSIPVADLMAGDLELRIEANQFATAAWNGEAVLTLTANIPALPPLSDTIKLKVAPFLMLSHQQPVKTLYVREYPTRNDNFIAQLQSLVPQAGATLQIVPGNAPYPANNIWLQDTMEVGFTQMPGQPAFPVVLRANRGPSRTIDNYGQDTLLGPNYGWLQWGSYRSTYAGGSAPNGWLDWYGNLEVTPPMPGYPYGRVYYGKNGTAGLNPDVVNGFAAQSLQGPPLAVDTGWLLIKHVDEILCFVPSGNPARPWKVLFPDTNAFIALLDLWSQQGHGSAAILANYETGLTVNGLRGQTSLLNFNRNLQSQRIEPIITQFKAEFGLLESDIIRIPSFYNTDGSAKMPAMTNSAVVNDFFLISDPWGPRPAGTDLMQQHVRGLLADVPLTPYFLDDWRYHTWSGNTHCATNVLREPFAGLWQISEPSIGAGLALY